MRKKITLCFVIICVCTLALSAIVSDETSYKDAIKLELAQELSSETGQSIDLILTEHSQFLDDYAEMMLQEKQEISEIEIKHAEHMKYLNDILNLSSVDIKNLKNNLGLSQNKHNQIQDYVYKFLDNLSMQTIEESEKIETIINNLFWIKELNYRDDDDYDFAVFMTNPDNLSDSQLYFVDSIRLEKWLEKERMKDPDYLRKDDIYKIFVRIDETNVDGSNATAKVNIETNYLYPDNTLGTSLSDYSIAFVNIDGKWLINDIRDNSSKESYYLDNEIKINVEEMVNDLNAPLSIEKQLENEAAAEKLQQNILEQEKSTAASIPYITAYTVSYARTYFRNYNINFPSYDGVDCQNFASQSDSLFYNLDNCCIKIAEEDQNE